MVVSGILETISGPVVIASGMAGAKMYDVVRLGELELTGEIIKLVGERATIQVYEDTSGLKPGEKVVSTNEPLSVELGPGLLTSFYDGIQRPLEAIEKKSGVFIARGVNVPSLDRKKKWKFEPKVKKGDKVKVGDILGTVQETELIEHRVMSTVEGKVEEIEEGSFTVEETVAKVNDGKKTHALPMMQKWFVRKGRPYAQKFDPVIPLVTGQRIIDVFFPIAKGGTACVPGPFGSGKCVSGDTPVLLADGRFEEIEKVYEKNISNGRIVLDGRGFEDIIYCDLPELMSFDGKAFVKKKPPAIYSVAAKETVRVKTRAGRESETTPVHEYHIITPDFQIKRVRADALRVGDRIVVPRKIEGGVEAEIVPEELLKDEKDIYITDANFLGEFQRHLRKLKKEGKLNELSKKCSVPLVSLYNYIAGRDFVPVQRARAILGPGKASFSRAKGRTSHNSVNLPRKLDRYFAEFLGLLASDGTIMSAYVGFRNKDEKLHNRFAFLAKRLFGAECWRCEKGEDSRISSSVLSKYLRRIFGSGNSRKLSVGLPSIVLQSKDEQVCAFLRGFFHGDGSISKHEIYFPTANKQVALGLAYLFLRLGVVYRLEKREVTSRTYYRVVVPGKREVLKLLRLIEPLPAVWRTKRAFSLRGKEKWGKLGTDSVPIDVEMIRDLLKSLDISHSKLCKKRINIYDYFESRKMPNDKFFLFAELIGAAFEGLEEGRKGKYREMAQRIAWIAEIVKSVYFDEIREIERINRPKMVYDFTVPETHNFIGGHGWVVNSNTVIQHQFAKWSDTQIVIYVGCGERGNEMTEVLTEFPKLIDPKSGKPLMMRTVLIANTSNMPVAAREASIYTGVTLAEYYRDMGYDVSIMADSTSRWAEAMREIGGRLEEMPGEEGYPAYLGRRLAEFYERAGRVQCLGSNKNRTGSVTIIGAVSPPGGDISEPVSQNTLRVTKVFLALDAALAQRRHFPAFHWLRSYSLYTDVLEGWYSKEVSSDFVKMRKEAMALLQKEAELQEIVQLVGPDALPEKEQAVLNTTKMIREDFLQQSAYHDVDTYASTRKQYLMLKNILKFHERAMAAVDLGIQLRRILEVPVKEKIARMKEIPEKNIKDVEHIANEIDSQFDALGRSS